MPGQVQVGATLLPGFTADVAISKGAAVVLVAATEDHVALPAGANSALVLGFATNDAAITERVAVQIGGGVAIGKAGGAIALGDYVMINSNLGDLKSLVLGASNQYVVGKALRAAAAGDLFPVKPLDFIAQGA